MLLVPAITLGQVSKSSSSLGKTGKVSIVKIVDGGLGFYFLFSLYFIFSFLFSLFSIFRTTQVKVYQSRCHISHKLMAKSQD